MPGSGTRTFLDPDHYEASLRQAQIEILIALSPKFKARLTWAELHDLQVLRCEEDFPRVSGAFRATAGMGRDRIGAWRDGVPRPRRAAAPVDAWRLGVERDSTGPGAAPTAEALRGHIDLRQLSTKEFILCGRLGLAQAAYRSQECITAPPSAGEATFGSDKGSDTEICGKCIGGAVSRWSSALRIFWTAG